MKRLFLLLAIFFTLALPFAPRAAAAEDSITVYNWGQYIADGTGGSLDVLNAFTEATGIHVNYVTYDSNETMYTKLKTGGSVYDVIIPSDYMVAQLIAEDMLEPLDFSNIPNYQYIDPSFRGRDYDPDDRYSVPYTWGTVGLIYNTRYVEPTTTWRTLWDSKYQGKILMFDNPRDAFAIAELLEGLSVNTEDQADLTRAAALLQAQKPVVQQHVMDQIFDAMERGEAWVAPYYAGDYLMMAEENPDLAFCFPDEGFNLFIDAMCIPKGCANKAGAEAFINFLCDPEISGQNLDYLGYSTPISAARAYMEPETAESPIAYPDEATLARGVSFRPLSTDAVQRMNALWLDVKAAGTNTTVYLTAAGAALAVLAALTVYLRLRRRRKLARRGISRRV